MRQGKRIAVAIVTGLLVACVGVDAALAQAGGGRTVGDMANDFKLFTGSLVDFVTVMAFLVGAGMAIAGFLKFYAHSKNPNDPSAKISTAFVFLLVGAGLVALPATLGSGIETIFGGGARSIDAGQGFRTLN